MNTDTPTVLIGRLTNDMTNDVVTALSKYRGRRVRIEIGIDVPPVAGSASEPGTAVTACISCDCGRTWIDPIALTDARNTRPWSVPPAIECPVCHTRVWPLRHEDAMQRAMIETNNALRDENKRLYAQLDERRAELEKLRAETLDYINDLIAQKDAAYSERAKCVALAARLALRLGMRVGVLNDPNEPDWPVLVIELQGVGQVSWHISKADYEACFGPDGGWLPPYPNEWDGHDTEEKYRRLLAFVTPDFLLP